jgi:hypothetical protein
MDAVSVPLYPLLSSDSLLALNADRDMHFTLWNFALIEIIKNSHKIHDMDLKFLMRICIISNSFSDTKFKTATNVARSVIFLKMFIH